MLSVQIPDDRKQLEQSIESLKWLLNQDLSEKDRNIFAQTLEAYKRALEGYADRKIQIYN